MKKQNSYPSDWEEVFNLILSLVEQVREDVQKDSPINADELEDYFYRLTRGTLGENEFTRRMAFEGYPIIRIAALPVLWRHYGAEDQPVPPDFIVKIGDSLACVEVKNRHWKTLIKDLEISARSLNNCIKFKEKWGLDLACFAMKRFGKWYLLDIEKIKLKSPDNYDNYHIPIQEAINNNLLVEELIVFNLGDPDYSDSLTMRLKIHPPEDAPKEGIFYKDLPDVLDEKKEILTINYGIGFNRKPYSCISSEKKIIEITYEMIEQRITEIFSFGYEFDDIDFIEDFLPTKFLITDRLRDKYKKSEVEGFFNRLQRNIFYIGDNESTRWYAYRIMSIKWREYIQKLRPEFGENFDIKDIANLLKEINKIRSAFNKEG